jgi:hypothetical protein
VSAPLTAKDLAQELSPILEQLVNIRYVLEHRPSSRDTLEKHETAMIDRLVERVLDALRD